MIRFGFGSNYGREGRALSLSVNVQGVTNYEQFNENSFLLLGLNGILFEDFGDAFIDGLGNYLGIRLQISAGSSL